ncbi:MAG: hypothetical protein ACTSRI_03300 [Promethearchaeota archaeon]
MNKYDVVMAKLKVKKIVAFKHGVSFYILDGSVKGKDIFELEFKIDEMNDVLKSLLVLDSSEKGYVSSISYDAAIDSFQLLKTIMLNIPDNDSFSSLLTQIKGAKIKLTIGSSEKITGTVMGIEFIERLNKEGKITEKLLTLLKDDDMVKKIPFSEISAFEILNDDLKKDLKFFLDSTIAGKKKDSKKISINCESGGDDNIVRSIIVSYIRQSPIWKTSYRLIVSKKQEKENKCILSGWALIENVTNQDWEDIELSLVAGMPVSFVYDFYRPIYIERPIIEPPKVLSAQPTEIEDGLETEKFKEYAADEAIAPLMAKKKARLMAPKPAARKSIAMGGAMPSGTSIRGEMGEQALFEKITSQTAVQTKDLGELFQYDIINRVSIKRKHSALVPILTEEIMAKKMLLYNKNEHDKNPNACLEITNNTEFILERGPATIIYDDNLAGEAIIPFLNKDDTRILNYAVEQAVIIYCEDKTINLKVHKISFSGAYCYEYYYTNIISIYKIRNKTSEEKELYLDHPKKSGYKVKESPMNPEETPNYWRFKLKLKPKDAITFEIKEQKENYSSNYLWNWNNDVFIEKISFYIKNAFIDAKIESQLKEIGELISKKNVLAEIQSKLENENYQMTEEQERLRKNISVLSNTTQESSLREKYVKKLSNQENRFEKIATEIKKLEQEIKTLDKEIEEKLSKLQYK